MSHPDEHLIVFEPDHGSKAVDLLLWQQKGKVRFEGFARALGAGAQLAEHTAWSVIIGASTIQGAEGKNLDRWGIIVGELRGGVVSDEEYRKLIELRIRVNTQHPSEDAMWSLISDAVAPNLVVAADLYPAGKAFVVHTTDWLPEPYKTRIGALVRDFRPVGVIVPVVEAGPLGFTFGWVSTGSTGSTFASVAEPDGDVFTRLIYSGRGRA